MQPSVQLRPTTEADLPVLARFQSEADISGQFNWFGFYQFGGPAALRRRWMENGLIDNERGLLIVTHADDPALVAGGGDLAVSQHARKLLGDRVR